MKKLPKRKKSKSLNILLKIIPVLLILFVLLGVYFIIKPKANDDIYSLGNKGNAIFENINPNFTVQFGVKDKPDTQWVRFEAKPTAENPFEEDSSTFLQKIADKVLPKSTYGIEMSLKGVQLSQTEQLEEVDEDVLTVAEILGTDEIKTSVELVESGRVIGENNQEPVAKKTVLNESVVEGVDIEYQILEGIGLKEEIVIRSLEEYTKECEGNISECKLPLNEFIFDLKIDEGLELKYGWFTYKGKSTKGYYFTDNKGRYVAHFLHNWAIDHSGNKTYDVDFEVLEKGDNHYEAKITVDINWLFSPERVYPVRIDPSIVHDTKTEFDMGTNYNTEVVDGPKVQLKDYNPVDANTVGYWKMNETISGNVPKDCSALKAAGANTSGHYQIDPDGVGGNAPFKVYCDMVYDGGGWTLLDNFVSSNSGDTDPYLAAIGGSNIKTSTDLTNAGYTTYITNIEEVSYTRVNGYLQMFYGSSPIGYIQKTLPSYANQVYVKWGNWYGGSATLSIGGSVVQSLGANYGAATYQGTYSSGNVIKFEENGIFWVGEIWVRDTNASASSILMIEDSSSYGNDGIADTTTRVNGVDSYAREFEAGGTGDSIHIPDSPELRMASGGTISAWIYPENYGYGHYYGYGRIISKEDSGGFQLYLNALTRSIRFLVNTGGFYTQSESYSIDLNKWQHVAVTFSSSGRKIYVNGEDVTFSGSTVTNLPGNTSSDIRIGAAVGTSVREFDGYIDEVYMSSSVFTDAEIKELYLNSMVERDGSHKSTELDLGSNSFLDEITLDSYGDATNEEEPFSTTGLVAQWNFNEKSGTTAAVSGGTCGSSCNGTLTNMTTTGQDVSISSGWTYNGRKAGDGALVFDGTDDRVVINSHSSLGLTTGLTIESWVKPYSYSTGGYNHILDKHGTYGLSIYNGKPSLYMTAGGWWHPDIEPLELNKWSHVVAQYNGINKTIYVNGVQVAQTLQSGSISVTSNAVGIGATSAGPYYFNGVIDTTRVYSRAITTSEILSHYKIGNIDLRYRTSIDGTTWSEWNGGSEKKIDSMDGNLCSSDIHGLVAYYPMDETSGTVMYDAKGSNNANVSGSYITEGKHNKSRSFTNSGDAAIVSSEISLFGTPYTIETWFKWPLAPSASWNTLTRGSTGDHQVIVQRSTMLLGTYSSDISSFVSSGFNMNNLFAGWHHLAAVASDGTTRFYIDGKHVGTAASKSERGIYAIGNYQGGGQQFGTIDEFKIYNIELTPQQITKNFLQGSQTNSTLRTESSNIRMEGNSSFRIPSSNYSPEGYTAAHWKLDEVNGTGAYLKDNSFYSNHGTPVGATYTTGNFDGARDFNGSTSYIDIGTAVAPSLPVTISAWVKPDSVQTGHIVNTGKNYPAAHNHNGVWMTLYNNQVNIGFGNNTACGPSARREVATTDSATVPVGQWSHVVGVMESDTVMKIYINTTEASLGAYDGTATFLANNSSLPGSIGAWTDCGSGSRIAYFDGSIDDVAIINRAYTRAEVAELYYVNKQKYVSRETESDVKEGMLMTRYPGYVGHPNNLSEMLADFHVYNPSSPKISATGGTISYEGIYKSHKFTSSGTLSISSGSGNAKFLIVAGGGGGGGAYGAGNEGYGGGGAGGLLTSFDTGLISLSTNNYSVVVGGGGSQNNKGGNSSAFGYTAEGGGFGGYYTNGGGPGGSGGGGRGYAATRAGGIGNAGPPRQGYNGGEGQWLSGQYMGGGGGGGAAANGGAGTNTVGGAGGSGRYIPIEGGKGYYAGGGGGARDANAGAGGIGGGGAGFTGVSGNGTSGTANTGGGGGGAGRTSGTGGSGGSGVVIVSYPYDYYPVYTKEIVSDVNHANFGEYYNTMYSTEMEVLVSGTWQFAVDGDDAVIAAVGGTTVAGKYGPGGACNCFTYAGSISLTAGTKYTVNVWHEEDGGGDSARLFYKDPNDSVWKIFSVSNTKGSAKLRAYALPDDQVNTLDYITNGMPSLSELEKPTALPFWIASDKVGTNLELTYGENEYVNYEPDRYTLGHWSFEEDASTGIYIKDSSGNNLNGTLSGTVHRVGGRIGNAGNFAGGSAHTITTPVSSILNNDVHTIEYWIQFDQVNDAVWRDFMYYRPSGSDRSPSLWVYPSQNCIHWRYDPGNTEGTNCGGPGGEDTYFNVNEWYHVAGVKNGGTFDFYVNGRLVKTTNGVAAVKTAGTAAFTMGGTASVTLDEVRVSNTARSANEIRQSYEIGKRTHPIKVNFKANLLSGNLISSSGDYSFSIDERPYGANNYIEHLEVGEKIIVKENYNGVEYIAQGNIATRNKDTGAVTVSSWDSGSTFPSGGYTVNSTVFKWQKEYVDLRQNLADDVDDISRLTFRKTTDVGANFWIDDARLTSYGKTSSNTVTPADSYLYGSSDDNLVAYFPMDETSGQLVKNVAGTKNGIATGTTVGEGYNSNARVFNGSSDYLSLSYDSVFNPSVLTVASWIKTNSSATQSIVALPGCDFDQSPCAYTPYQLYIDGGYLKAQLYNNSSQTITLTSPTQVNTNNWHHVALSFGGGVAKLFIDGEVVASDSLSGTMSQVTNDRLFIGATWLYSTGVTRYFAGSIDEVRIYNRTLTADEILQQYDSRINYIQYDAMFSRWSNNTDQEIYLYGVGINYTPDGPTMDQVMRHGKWFSGGEKQPYWWAK